MPTITQALAKLQANLPDFLPEDRLLRIAAGRERGRESILR